MCCPLSGSSTWQHWSPVGFLACKQGDSTRCGRAKHCWYLSASVQYQCPWVVHGAAPRRLSVLAPPREAHALLDSSHTQSPEPSLVVHYEKAWYSNCSHRGCAQAAMGLTSDMVQHAAGSCCVVHGSTMNCNKGWPLHVNHVATV